MHRARGATLPVLSLMLALGCTGSRILEPCMLNIATMEPPQASLAVGDTLTFHVRINAVACAPADTLPSQLRWSTGDTAVVRVDSLTGLVTARHPGQGGVSVSTSVTHTALNSALIIVTGP